MTSLAALARVVKEVNSYSSKFAFSRSAENHLAPLLHRPAMEFGCFCPGVSSSLFYRPDESVRQGRRHKKAIYLSHPRYTKERRLHQKSASQCWSSPPDDYFGATLRIGFALLLVAPGCGDALHFRRGTSLHLTFGKNALLYLRLNRAGIPITYQVDGAFYGLRPLCSSGFPAGGGNFIKVLVWRHEL